MTNFLDQFVFEKLILTDKKLILYLWLQCYIFYLKFDPHFIYFIVILFM